MQLIRPLGLLFLTFAVFAPVYAQAPATLSYGDCLRSGGIPTFDPNGKYDGCVSDSTPKPPSPGHFPGPRPNPALHLIDYSLAVQSPESAGENIGRKIVLTVSNIGTAHVGFRIHLYLLADPDTPAKTVDLCDVNGNLNRGRQQTYHCTRAEIPRIDRTGNYAVCAKVTSITGGGAEGYTPACAGIRINGAPIANPPSHQ